MVGFWRTYPVSAMVRLTRHLLTTGWSGFVNKKKLLFGDDVLFLRASDGELRWGIRRAAQVKSDFPLLALSHKSNVSSINVVVNAISTSRVFNICYNPSLSPRLLLQWWEQPLDSGAPVNNNSPLYYI
ncbi:hypothetical protein Vadar_000924 [Vaccinium darrowii]|uniref:Uncharacterized protein n=1 Tax=Vaccinium darrowii TaxID=229202 RepID=A0ACB7YT56_9ERIC|nr:hypothetical protein Vadar_000924 [Vaccinium darrowii]